MRYSSVSQAIALALCLTAPAFSAQAQTKVDVSTGLNYSSGKYGDVSSTNVLVAPFSVRVKTGNWTFKGTLPYVRLDGPANASVVFDDQGGNSGGGGNRGPGGGGGPGPGRDRGGNDNRGSTGGGTTGGGTTTLSRKRSNSGIGDATLSATYSFAQLGGSDAYLDLGGRVKLDTGDDKKGLGVGTTDYGVSAELGIDKDAGGGYVSLGRRFLGSVAGIQRQDGWQGEIGGWRNLSENTSIGGGYDWRQSSVKSGKDPSEVFAYLSYRVSDAWRLNFNASGGLNKASADYSVGVTVSWRVSER